jgi:two-component system response regulator YesN
MNDFLKESISKIMALHKGRKSKRGRKVVQDALDCISEDLYSPELSLGFVAQKIFANESYLSRVFKKEVGQSFIEYVLKKRIEESIRLLNTTDDKVYEIAEKVGFKDSHYFSLCFKKVTGVTVKEYRRGREDV